MLANMVGNKVDSDQMPDALIPAPASATAVQDKCIKDGACTVITEGCCSKSSHYTARCISTRRCGPGLTDGEENITIPAVQDMCIKDGTCTQVVEACCSKSSHYTARCISTRRCGPGLTDGEENITIPA